MGRIPEVAERYELVTSRFEWTGGAFVPGSPITEDQWARGAWLFLQVVPGLQQTPFIERVPRGCKVLRYPALAMRPAWPLYLVNPRGSDQHRIWEHFIPFHDRLGIRIAGLGLSPSQAAKAYLETDLSTLVALDRMAEIQFHECRAIDALSDVQLTPFIEKHWRQEQLFLDLAHPGNTLIHRILSHLKACALDDPFWAGQPEPLERFDYCQETEVPVHPQVAEHFRLAWAPPGRKYFMLDAFMDFEEYLTRAFEPVLSQPIRGRLSRLLLPRAGQAARSGDPIEAVWLLASRKAGLADPAAQEPLTAALARMDPAQFAECCLALQGIPYTHFEPDPPVYLDAPCSRIERALEAWVQGDPDRGRGILAAGLRAFPHSDLLRRACIEGPQGGSCPDARPGVTEAPEQGGRLETVRNCTAELRRRPGRGALRRLVRVLGGLEPPERIQAVLAAAGPRSAQPAGTAVQPPTT